MIFINFQFQKQKGPMEKEKFKKNTVMSTNGPMKDIEVRREESKVPSVLSLFRDRNR